jgi:poly(3-hydroxybutyrate) depolymerase
VGTWYTGDFVLADDVFACAVAQNLVNPRRVYTAGCSAGGFQAGAMVFARSSYLAAAMISSGGAIQGLTSMVFEEPRAIPAVITTYGDGSDILDFGVTSKAECDAVKKAGGMAVNCPYGNGHCKPPDAIRAAQWQFLKDHPFGVGPEPYRAGLPSSFPDACTLF